MTGINAIIYILSTIPPWYLVDRWGRRLILLTGAVVVSFSLLPSSSAQVLMIGVTQMGVALAATGWWMYIDVPETPKAVVTCVIIYNAAFGYRYMHAKPFSLITSIH